MQTSNHAVELPENYVKRVFDICFTIIIAICVLSWFIPTMMLLQKMFNPGPVFYRGKRWGKNGREFYCIKFRSMKTTSEHKPVPPAEDIPPENDPRITKFGKILRKLHIDEIPQFFNVLVGDMSVVGPRPHDVVENIALIDQIPNYHKRHQMKPGITGWAQIHGFRGRTKDISLMKKRVEYDLWYISHWSLILDILIIIKTIFLPFYTLKNGK